MGACRAPVLAVKACACLLHASYTFLLPAVQHTPKSNPVEARAKSLWLLQSVLICGWADGKWMVDLLRALVLPPSRPPCDTKIAGEYVWLVLLSVQTSLLRAPCAPAVVCQ